MNWGKHWFFGKRNIALDVLIFFEKEIANKQDKKWKENITERIKEHMLGVARVLLLFTELVQLFVTPWTVAARLLCPWDFPGKNTGVGCYFLLQGIFRPRDWIYVPCIAGGFFTTKSPGKPLQGY